MVEAVRNVAFGIDRQEFVVLLGPSGCGKTTLLQAIGGLVPVTGGAIRANGKVIAGPGPDRVMVFQEFSLFRWRTVRRNIEFALECKAIPRPKRGPIVDRLLRDIGLERQADTYPDRLSGGMKQRVAIARALAYDAEMLLMDEPFGALDAQTRILMQTLLLRIWEGSGKMVLFVTHDIDEAIFLADRILVMSAGPGVIKGEYLVTAPRPRTTDFLLSEAFLELKRQIFASIQAEDFRFTRDEPARDEVTAAQQLK